MSSILTEDTIKSSYKTKGQLENNTCPSEDLSSDEKLNQLFDKRFDEKFNQVFDKRFDEKFNQVFDKRFDVSYDERYEHLFMEYLLPLIESKKSLENEVSELKETVEILQLSLKTLGCNPSEVVNISTSKDGSKYINEVRAKQIFPELKRQKQLSPGDIIRMCKLGKRGHESAHRVMDMAEKLYPDECRHDISTVSNKAKHWLVHKDHIGFKD